ncbi:Transportin-2 [Babesia microti strain RI]|uniref:Transportin-2 n=1 Tax=Babesia microti (strain RI) TaxID=1133968 RepID=A0A0K3ANI5_BABMR|nr:Transportin-2 [Babesia microti strain RI]CTQ41092.1 Transportin-2 [Babesia microti strain RI]|eukprot:XP_012649103.1 Transportin-2 [Babesia microti strain RI]
MATWEDNPAVLNELLDILREFSVPDTKIQRVVQQRWSNFESTHQDAPLYLLKVSITTNVAQVSQLSTLLLRRSIERASLLPDWIKDVLKNGLLEAIMSPSKELRDAASAALCSLYTHEGYHKWPQLPLALFNLIICDNNTTASLGAARALYDICLELVNKDSEFAQFAISQLLPQINSCAVENLVARNFFGKLVCLLCEASDIIWTVYFQIIWQYAIESMQTVAKINISDHLASELCVSVMKIVNESWQHHPEVIISSIDTIIMFILHTPELLIRHNVQSEKVSGFQIESIDFFPRVLRANKHSDRARSAIVGAIESHLKHIIPYLVNLTQYSEFDYMSMDHSQLENDNSAVPDREQDINIRYKQDASPDDMSGIEDDFQGNVGSTWGSIWTKRKAAALAIDHLAVSFGPRLLDDILKIIEQRLSDNNWEIAESAVLTLGAIARGCSNGLAPFLPKVLPYLFELSKHENPLMRSIACWCVARFSSWASQPENCNYWTNRLISVLLDRVLDNNKRVQEAACSALATLIEESYDQITLHFESICTVIDKAFRSYQYTNSLLLYDILSEMIEAEERCHLESYSDDKLHNDQWKGFSLRNFIYIRLSNDWNETLKSSNHISTLCMAKYVAITDCTSIILRSERNNVDMHIFSPNNALKVVHMIFVMDSDSNLPAGIYESSFNVLSAIVEFYGVEIAQTIESLPDFVPLVIQSISNCNGSALSAGLALIGDLSFKLSSLLVPHIQMILNISCGALDTYVDKLNRKVSTQSLFPIVNNSTWAIGVLCDCISVRQNTILAYAFSPHMNQVFNSLSVGLRCKNSIASSGSATALGKFAKSFPDFMKNAIFTILGIWSTVALSLKNPCDKDSVTLAICEAIEPANIAHIDLNDLSCVIRLLASVSNQDSNATVANRVLQRIKDSLSAEEWSFITR